LTEAARVAVKSANSLPRPTINSPSKRAAWQVRQLEETISTPSALTWAVRA
jgi:hypothetical protein